jgi:hypothetical protein
MCGQVAIVEDIGIVAANALPTHQSRLKQGEKQVYIELRIQ